MKKFIAIYLAPAEVTAAFMATMTPEKGKEEMAKWEAWMKTLGSAIVDPGAPFGKTKRVTKDGVTDVRNDLTGYTVVQAESHDAAAALFKECPHFEMEGASIDVMTWVDM